MNQSFVQADEIHLKERDFEPSELQRLFEELYLGPASTYRLFFPVERLPNVHDMFDKIIRQHGLREVSFDFEIEGFTPLEVEA